MATSPLIAATKPIGGSLTEELSPAESNYQLAMQRIMGALDAREGRNQQDMLLAVAQGMLTPGKTGSFGESVGQAAGNVREMQRQQDKEALENAQMRLQVAQAGREQEQLSKAQKAFQQKAGLGAPAAGGAAGAEGQQGGAPDMKTVSLQDAMEFIAAFPNQKELGARMMEAAKAGLDRYKMSMNGIVFDNMSGKYLNVDIPGQTQSDYSTPYGTFKMLPNEYSRFAMAQKAGMGREWMDAFKKGEQFGVDQLVAQKLEGKATTTGKPSEKAEGATDEGGRMTVSQQEAQSAAMKETATQRAKGENTRYQTIMDNGNAATSKMAVYRTMNDVISRKGMDQILGYFERPDFLSAAGKAIESGRWGSEALREVLQNLGAPQELIDNKMLLNSLVNQVGVDFSRLNKGQGAVSDYERSLYQSLGPNMKDPIGAFRKKTEMLNARAEFERDIATKLNKSKMNADEFVLESPQYEAALNKYYRTLERIVYGEERAPQKVTTPTGGNTSKEELQRLRDEAKAKARGG